MVQSEKKNKKWFLGACGAFIFFCTCLLTFLTTVLNGGRLMLREHNKLKKIFYECSVHTFFSTYFYDGTKVIPKMYLSELLSDPFLISVQYVYKNIVRKKNHSSTK